MTHFLKYRSLLLNFIHQVLNQREKQQKESWQSWNIAKLAMEKRGNAELQRQRKVRVNLLLWWLLNVWWR